MRCPTIFQGKVDRVQTITVRRSFEIHVECHRVDAKETVDMDHERNGHNECSRRVRGNENSRHGDEVVGLWIEGISHWRSCKPKPMYSQL